MSFLHPAPRRSRAATFFHLLPFIVFGFAVCFSPSAYAQPTPTLAESRLSAFAQKQQQAAGSAFAVLKPESIGPSIFSCRVTDVDADPADPSHFYVAYASGGLWYTESNGSRFRPVFDREASMTIGDIAVDWSHDVVWVGTGEANSSRSSYAGTGLYRSADGGKNWQWRGLPESHHIARIILHPTDTNTLWVAVLGHLYTPNAERGIYKTTDGGKSWQRTLFVDDKSGAIDLVNDPNDVNTLYAATWQRERHPWDFSGAGAGSGIWKSTDGGNTWTKLNTPDSGFPSGPTVGRIGLAAGRKNGKTILYACLDNQAAKPKKTDKANADALTKDQLRTMSKADFLALSDERLGAFLKKNEFPEKFNAQKIKGLIARDSLRTLALVEYLEDANANLFETDYTGAEVYRSDDGGQHWQRIHAEPLDGIHFTYGYYFSNVRCAADDADKLYLLGFLIIKSADGGKTWKSINGENVHVDHHALWIDPTRPGHLLNGNDGGLNASWDDGASWFKLNSPPVGQFYAVATDEADPYRVYGGLQDNGVWVGPSDYQASDAWQQTGQYPYRELLSGDGMQVAVDPRDNNTVYTGFQFGNYFRINQRTGETKEITPRHELGERPLRFNWQTPIHLSHHSADVLYLGANRLYRSLDRGDHWQPISGDLTGGGQKGNVPYGTLTSIHESPLQFGLLYTGSDDGLVQVSRDGGFSWTNISDALPPRLWVSRVQASAHVRGRVYAALNGYRWDDFSAYLYASENYGQTWTRLGLRLPAEPINVVREDPRNPDLLYIGTDHGLYASLDRGRTFEPIGADSFPHVPVHDLALQVKTGDLVVGTHGRSLYKVNVTALQQLTDSVQARPLYVFDIPKKKFYESWGKKQPWQALKGPELPIIFYANSGGTARWTVKTPEGLVLNNGNLTVSKGLNRFTFALDLREDVVKKYQKALDTARKDPKAKPVELAKSDTGQYFLQKGTFLFELEQDGKTARKEFILE